MPILSPEDEFWVTLAHCLLDRGAIPARHRARLAALAAGASELGALADGLRDLLPPHLSPMTLLEASRAEDWTSLEALVPLLVRAARERSRPGTLLRLARAAKRLPGRLRDARLRRGVGVALLGPDGAGKSTLANGIEQYFVFPVRQVYMGLTGGMLRHVDRLRIPGVVRLGRLLVIWSRYLRARYHMARGRLVVFDRYIYDADVPTPHPLSAADRLGRWVDGRSCPAPDLILVLDAPGELMHQRKGEYDPLMLEEWRLRFRALQQRRSGVEIIDTTRDTGTVRAEVIGRLWRCYTDRWKRERHATRPRA